MSRSSSLPSHPSVPFLGADAVALCPPRAAASAIAEALREGLDPAAGSPRSVLDVAHGQLLLMPAETPDAVGVKVVTVAPANADRGLPRVHGIYLLMDARTLAPTALIDGAALTTLRTPAVSAAALAALTGLTGLTDRFASPVDVVVFGAGPQGVGHVAALADIDGITLGRVAVVVRHPDRVSRLQFPAAPSVDVLGAGSPEARQALQRAGLVVCATSSATPVFDAAEVSDTAVVVAVGSHLPTEREVPTDVMARSTVIVEDVATALREAGDVVLAMAEGGLQASDLVTMADVIRGEVMPDARRGVVIKTCGMAWQDLVVAEALIRRANGRGTDDARDPV